MSSSMSDSSAVRPHPPLTLAELLVLTVVLAALCGLVVPLIHDSPDKQLTLAAIIALDALSAVIVSMLLAALVNQTRRRAGKCIARVQPVSGAQELGRYIMGLGVLCGVFMSVRPLLDWSIRTSPMPHETGLLLFNHWLFFTTLVSNFWFFRVWFLRVRPAELCEQGILYDHGLYVWPHVTRWSLQGEVLEIRYAWRVWQWNRAIRLSWLIEVTDRERVEAHLHRCCGPGDDSAG